MSWRFVRHDLLDLADAGTIWVAGPCDAAHAMFFCAGFPCDHSSFAPLAARFAEVGCLVGVGCMPEYDREEGCLRPEGYDLPQIGRCFGQAVAALLGQATAAPKVTLVVHDWGIAPGFFHSNVVGCDKLVVFDVLPVNPKVDPPDSVYYSLCHLNYQSMFATSFLLHRYSRALGWAWLLGGQALLFVLLGKWLNPAGPKDGHRGGKGLWWVYASATGDRANAVDKESGGSLPMTPYRCYPYFHALKTLFRPAEAKALQQGLSFDASLAKQPICYIYGEEKNTMFHTRAQLAKLRAKEGCVVVGVPRAGHWCYKHEPEACYAAVKVFVLGE